MLVVGDGGIEKGLGILYCLNQRFPGCGLYGVIQFVGNFLVRYKTFIITMCERFAMRTSAGETPTPPVLRIPKG